MIAANCSAKADFGYNPFRLLFRVIRLISCQFVVAKLEASTTKCSNYSGSFRGGEAGSLDHEAHGSEHENSRNYEVLRGRS